MLQFRAHFQRISHIYVVGVMKMGNIVPRVGLEPTSVAFRASVLPLHHLDFPDVITVPTPTCGFFHLIILLILYS